MKQKQSEADLRCHLDDCIQALQLSSDAYDNGFRSEAKRLAVTARVLLHDTKQSKSLLGLLNLKDTAKFWASPQWNVRGNVISENDLIIMRATVTEGGGCEFEYLPVLDDGPPVAPWKQLGFEAWWEQVIVVDKDHRQLSRRKVILALANKDGGAHVDPKLDEIYADLSRNNSFGWEGINPDGSPNYPDRGPVFATMRQIAHELVKSLVVYK